MDDATLERWAKLTESAPEDAMDADMSSECCAYRYMLHDAETFYAEARAAVPELINEVKRLRDVVRFYAESDAGQIAIDAGRKAREALPTLER